MATIRTTYIEAADCVERQLTEPAIAMAWDAPSALAEMTVGALAGHLANQIFRVEQMLAADPGPEPPISLLDHYARVEWIDAALDDEANAEIRRSSQEIAADGPVALASRVADAVRLLHSALPAEPTGRVVFLPWGPWSLTLDDMLVTRLMEIAVHCDDLACSVGVALPELPADAVEVAVMLLARLAVRRHGPASVLRALSRHERAPASIAAF